MPEGYPIIPFQSFLCPKPHKTLRILQNSTYRILRQPIPTTKILKIILFIYRLYIANDSRYYRYNYYNDLFHISD